MPDTLPVFIPLGTITPLVGTWGEFPNPSTNGGVYRLRFTPTDDEIDSTFHLLLRRKWGTQTQGQTVERSEFFYPKDEVIVFSLFPEPFFIRYYGHPKWEAMLGYKRYFRDVNFTISLEEIESDPYYLDGEVVI